MAYYNPFKLPLKIIIKQYIFLKLSSSIFKGHNLNPLKRPVLTPLWPKWLPKTQL